MSPIGPSPMARPTPLSVVAAMRATVNPTTKPSSVAADQGEQGADDSGLSPPGECDTRLGSR